MLSGPCELLDVQRYCSKAESQSTPQLSELCPSIKVSVQKYHEANGLLHTRGE